MFDQVERRDFCDGRPVQGDGRRKLSEGPLRTIGSSSPTLDGEDIEIPRSKVDRGRDAPREDGWQGARNLVIEG